jgi:DNA-binding HxlR family transcriptional regulator
MPRVPRRPAPDTTASTGFFLRFPGSTLVITLLADKWTIPVIHELSRGTRRTGELKDALGTVSQKMLTQTLRMLEVSGLVERKVYPVVPPRVEYSLTPMGESINAPLAGICEWVEQHGAALAALHARRQRAAARKEQAS